MILKVGKTNWKKKALKVRQKKKASQCKHEE